MIRHQSFGNSMLISKYTTKNSENEYVLTFPPRTAMGLELEPVILSTNPPRQIGCRVKDFYFGTDFIEGINIPSTNVLWTKDFLMARVKVGDVICKVDNERVVSKSFAEILAMLRDLRNTDRCRLITFRNISSHVPAKEQPSKYQKMNTVSSSFSADECLDGGADCENIVPSNSEKSHISRGFPKKIDTIDGVEKLNSIKTADSINSGEECFQHVKKNQILLDRSSAPCEVSISPRAIKELVAMNNPSPKVSPNGVTRGSCDLSDSIDHYGERLFSSHYCSATSSPSISPLPSQKRSQYEISDRVPSEISETLTVQSENLPATMQSNFHAAFTPYAPNREALAHLIEVGGTISSGLIEVSTAVGSVLSEQAEKVIEKTSKIIPFYNATEMSSVQAKKNDLLKELSRLCVLLGQAEEREKEYTVRLLQGEYLKETVAKLESNLDSVVIENEMLRSQLKSLKTGNAALISENTNCESEKKSILLANTELLEENTSLAVQVARLEERLIAAENHSGIIQEDLDREMSRFDREEARWHQEMDRIAQEQHAMRTELEFVINNSVKQLEASEKKRDNAYAEMAAMRVTIASNSNLAEKEFARLKNCMASQRDLYDQSLEEKELSLSDTKISLMAAEEQNRRQVAELELAMTRISILMKENSQMQEKIGLLVKTSHLVSSEKSELLKKREDLQISFEAEKRLLIDQSASTKKRLEEFTIENDRLKLENNLLREQLGSQKQQFELAIDSLHERCSRFETDRDAAQREFVSTLALVEMNADAAKESLRATVAELSDKLSSVSNEEERYNAEVLELKLQCEVLKAELAASKKEVGESADDLLMREQQGNATLLSEATLVSDLSLSRVEDLGR